MPSPDPRHRGRLRRARQDAAVILGLLREGEPLLALDHVARARRRVLRGEPRPEVRLLHVARRIDWLESLARARLRPAERAA
ncbi:MAG TPA: hypothetical protein VF406_04585 [Thermodesulfobacteriota bacterium]